MAPAEDSSAERESAADVSNSTAEAQDQDVFINPLPIAATSAASEPGGEAAPQHPVSSSAAAQPRAGLDTALTPADSSAQPLADDDAEVGEAHALLPQHHARSAAQSSADADTTAYRGSDVQGREHDGRDSDSVSMDSPAAGRPPDCSTSTMANPYFQIHGALRTPLEEQPNRESSSSRGHKLLLAGLGALPLQARRMLPETLLSLLQCRERQDEQLAPDAADHLPGCKVREEDVMRKVNRHLLSRFLMLTMLCYLDRTNLAFAALQLNRDLGYV